MLCRLPGVPIIIATGYADANLPRDDKFRRLKKPFNQAQLQDIIAQAVGTTAPA